jgi:hypothetical protein
MDILSSHEQQDGSFKVVFNYHNTDLITFVPNDMNNLERRKLKQWRGPTVPYVPPEPVTAPVSNEELQAQIDELRGLLAALQP